MWASDHDGIRATNEQEPTAKRATETETQSTFELLKKDCSWYYCKRIRNWKHNEHLSFSPKDCVHGSQKSPPWGKITRDLHLALVGNRLFWSQDPDSTGARNMIGFHLCGMNPICLRAKTHKEGCGHIGVLQIYQVLTSFNVQGVFFDWSRPEKF